MEIGKISSQRQQSLSSTVQALGKHISETDTSFSAELNDQQGSLTREQLEALLKKIDEQGAKLTKTPTYEELRAYRGLVQEFVNEAVSHMDELIYTTVRSIDDELEKMAEHIRLGQSDQLDIVASQDAIRGMLVDLYS